ncbi:MAG: tryptophan 2,3-dioxygenase family protein [Bacteroidia bacterium]|nr:tryptophan 2,3-dioxygenase family protein [Bacteroidia bacterium]
MANKDWKNQLTQILERLSMLEEKYVGMGQDMLSYLDGLYYSNGLTYWEYIHLDSLLGLQTPRTSFKDEVIFITYHQMTELWFKLIKQEIEALTSHQGEESEYLSAANWRKRLGRMVNYFKHLCNSFDIMLSGMDHEELRKFRMALLPASGFQSVQFREIEIMSTRLRNLIRTEENHLITERNPDQLFPEIYWKKGGIDLESGKKTITLKEFEKRYDEELIQLIHKYENQNLESLFLLQKPEIREDAGVLEVLREYDQYVNIYWKLSHLSAASKHLVSGGNDIDATGGTNWRTFLPPRYQRIIFFPEIWTSEEKESWGKAGVLKFFQQNISRNWMK